MGQGGSLAKAALIASLVAGFSYLYVIANDLSGPAATVWKGAGVTLLALYAALNARSTDGWLITAVIAFGALGDVLLDAVSLEAGAVAFIAGHISALALYIRNRRSQASTSQKLLATVTLPASVLIAVFSVPLDSRPAIGAYTAFVGAMAAAAWVSRFPRYRTGLGAMMFLASDLLIFARMGPLPRTHLVGFAVWSLYYLGQFLIVTGVVGVLAKSKAADVGGTVPENA